MTSKERLSACLNGEPVDRPSLNFYEVGGFLVDRNDPDPFNIYNSPSWAELLDLAENHTDLIRTRSPRIIKRNPAYSHYFHSESRLEGGSRVTENWVRINGHELHSVTRRDKDIDTIWTTEHLLKDADDLEAYLQLPDKVFEAEYDLSNMVEAENEVGDRGIVMVDSGDPLVCAASLFSMDDFTVIAMTEEALFTQLLEKFTPSVYHLTEFTAKNFPQHLWRIYGPEYASEPYLPPRLFEQYVVRFVSPMVKTIQRYGGKVRLHSHGRLLNILDMICGMGVDALDPIEPPPQGDVELDYVADNYGQMITLFGNLEISDIENLNSDQMRRIAEKSLEAGSRAKGFVLMPSASPYGREVPENTIRNYRTLVDVIENWNT